MRATLANGDEDWMRVCTVLDIKEHVSRFGQCIKNRVNTLPFCLVSHAPTIEWSSSSSNFTCLLPRGRSVTGASNTSLTNY